MKKTSDTNQLNGSYLAENAKQAARSTASAVQDSVQTGIAKTQDVLFAGLDIAQSKLKDTQKGSAKNLKKAQKSLGQLQDTVQPTLARTQEAIQTGLSVTQDALLSGLSSAQDVIGKGAKNASVGLAKTQKSIQEMSDSLQSSMESAVRRRKRRKFIFRLGLLTGLVLMLLYAPWPGSQTRQRIADFWRSVVLNQQ